MDDRIRDEVLEVIRNAGRQVTCADVVRNSGLSVNESSLALNRIAHDVGGHMYVSESGEVAYKFPRGLKERYLARGLAGHFSRLAALLRKAWSYAVRASFGILLIVTTVMLSVFIYIFSSMFRLSDSNNNSRIEFGFLDSEFFLLVFAAGRLGRRNLDENRRNFLLDCYQFVFGPQNPNADLEQQKWRLVSDVIVSKGGVVTQEQLAPYLDATPGDEDAMLPVLIHFDGLTEVTDSGNLVYVFEKLMYTTDGAKNATEKQGGSVATKTDNSEEVESTRQTNGRSSANSDLPQCIQEKRWQLFNLPPLTVLSISLLALFNLLIGALVFSFIGMPFIELVLMGKARASGLILMTTAPFFYAMFFLGMPIARSIRNSFRNHLISKRNRKRGELASALASPEPELKIKLDEAKSRSLNIITIDYENSVFNTSEDALAQEFNRMGNEQNRIDRRHEPS